MEQRKTSNGNAISILLGIISLAIIVAVSIVMHFGVYPYGVFFGILHIVIVGLPIAGGIVGYVGNRNLFSSDLLFNFAILALAIIAL